MNEGGADATVKEGRRDLEQSAHFNCWPAVGEQKFDVIDRGRMIEMTKFKNRRLAHSGRSRCDSGNWRPLGCDRGGRQRGVAVAPDDRSQLVAAKGSRSSLGEHRRCLTMSHAGGMGVEASSGAPVLGFRASTGVLVLGFGVAIGTARLPLFSGAGDIMTDIVVGGAAIAFEGVATGGVNVAG
ncbi:hypothetical protein B296_00021421 [Ensete ventricosum]|uniref:Uncharacterized protein n=1 Tax=Ensete ventricosum TaxID=4639 RepID=A0A426ZLE4_ENSVE|nr:hypothetical protein B296_00021421 [Ensete ventricosum]